MLIFFMQYHTCVLYRCMYCTGVCPTFEQPYKIGGVSNLNLREFALHIIAAGQQVFCFFIR